MIFSPSLHRGMLAGLLRGARRGLPSARLQLPELRLAGRSLSLTVWLLLLRRRRRRAEKMRPDENDRQQNQSNENDSASLVRHFLHCASSAPRPKPGAHRAPQIHLASGTGSNPPLVKGRQRTSRFSASTSPRGRRGARWLHTRNSSRKDETCRRRQKWAKESVL